MGAARSPETRRITKAVADAEWSLAEADRARAEAQNYKLRNEAILLELEKTRAQDDSHREYIFYNPIIERSVMSAVIDLNSWSRRHPGESITITFNSPGGYVTDGFALYDFLRRLSARGHKVITRAEGICASMAAILLQAGDERVMSPNAFLMIHEVSGGAEGKVSELEEITAVTKQFQKRGLAILSARATMSEDEIAERWKKKDWYMDAEEALELGFIDSIEE